MNLVPVEKLFIYSPYLIPDYQRGYSWETDQLQDFWEDLTNSIHVSTHFTGTLVLKKKEGYCEVVDGQQRLVTIYLVAKIINQVYYKGKKGLELYNLSLNGDDDVFFKKLLRSVEQGNEIGTSEFTSRSQLNLLKAIKYIFKMTKSVSAATQKNLMELLNTKFRFNVLLLDDELEEGLVFEVLNNRGLELTELDKVKNYLIYKANRIQSPVEREIIVPKISIGFGRIYKHLMGVMNSSASYENEFLDIAAGLFIGGERGNSYEKIRGFSYKDADNQVFNFLNDIIDHFEIVAKHFNEIYGLFTDTPEIDEYLVRINHLNKINDIAPLIIALRIHSTNYKVDHCQDALKKLEALIVRYLLSGGRRYSKLKARVFDLAFEVFQQKRTVSGIRSLINKIQTLNQEFTDNQSIRSQLRTTNFRGTEPVLKFILCSYEEELSYKAMIFGKGYQEVNITHISLAKEKRKQREYQRIGNFTLTKSQKKLITSNYNYALKTVFEKSEFISEANLAGEILSWSDKSIKTRGEKIIKFILNTWKPK